MDPSPAPAPPPSADPPADLGEVVREVVAALRAELRGAPAPPPPLDADLERDVGLDSLARVELLARLERRLGLALPERRAAEARSVADLARLAAEAGARPAPGPAAGAGAARVAMPAVDVGALPDAAATLLEVLDWHAARTPDRTQVWWYDDDGGDEPRRLTFADLQRGAEEVSAGLRERGLRPGEAVALMLPTGEAFFAAFFGALYAGGVPVPLYPPARPSQLEEHLRRQAGILRTCEAPLLVTVPEARRLGGFLRGQAPALRELPTPEELRAAGRCPARPAVTGADTAFIQFTSGSTGDPKGVVLTHANLLANVREIGRQVGPRPDDVFVSWLPLYHDMGLIGAVFATLYHAVPLVLMSPLRFLVRPARWLQALHRHRGTLSAAPNFAYELVAAKVEDAALEGLDLSAWRMTLNGAEPISPQAMDRFAARLARCGLRPEAMTPTYGLAEGSLALCMTPVGRGPRVDRIARDAFRGEGRAAPAAPGEAALEFVSCGAPIRGHEVRIVGADGREVEARREGRLQFRGPSATAGYFRNPAATAALRGGDGWLESGDLAYVADGEVHLTGRIKDIIIRAGRKLHPHELEQRVGEVAGVRRGCVVVFGARRPGAATEDLVVVAETRVEGTAARGDLEAAIRAAASDALGTPPDVVVLAPPHTVLKTSSGKVRRSACRELFERGELLRGPRAAWAQLLRIEAARQVDAARGAARRAGQALYAGAWWALFAAHWTAAEVVAVAVPGRTRRWRGAGAVARSLLRLTACPLEVRDAARLAPSGRPRVVVSNHQSYLDGLVLAAVLPPAADPAVVVKRELRGNPLTRVLLDGLGALYVERADAQASAEDARQLPAALAAGRTVVAFPEGTCLRMPGLLPFRLGAFAAAAEADAEVLPVVIRGTRGLLRPDTWFPRRAGVTVEVGAPLRPDGRDWAAAVRLRDRARAAILAGVAEPDLA